MERRKTRERDDENKKKSKSLKNGTEIATKNLQANKKSWDEENQEGVEKMAKKFTRYDKYEKQKPAFLQHLLVWK